MQLFYEPQIDSSKSTFSFSKEESRHILKVLRKKTGDKIFITNGKGNLFDCEIETQLGTLCEVKVLKETFTPLYSKEIHLAVCPTKHSDRFEWFLEKATEIGLSSITPIRAARSERKEIKRERLERIVQSAMKQSLRTYLPAVNETTILSDFLNIDFNGNKLIAHCENSQKYPMLQAIDLDKNTLILIGPEGDFSEEEIKMAIDKGFKPVTLGDQRLRTETAALLACILTNSVYGSF